MIGKVIKYARTEAGLKQTELGEKVNINRTTLGNYETEYSQPTFETIENILSACGYGVVFINKKTNEKFTSKDILRKDM